MRLSDDHHPVQQIRIPGLGVVSATGLADDAVWSTTEFEPYLNTVAQAKLLLLDAAGLNDVIKRELVGAGGIKPTAAIVDLRRRGRAGERDGRRPRRHDRGSARSTPTTPGGSTASPASAPGRRSSTGGKGNYPIWESCLVRPAFRTIYRDWENGAQQWPALGDAPSAQPGEDAPTASIALSGNTVTVGGTTYVGASHTFTLTADRRHLRRGRSLACLPDHEVRRHSRRLDAGGGRRAGDDSGGRRRRRSTRSQLRAEDPCHTFATDTLPDGGVASKEVFLDTTAPAISISSPAPEGVVFDTDDFSSIAWTATDEGSGVATESVTFDGAASSQGAVLDMFRLDPGTHAIVVQAADRLGNASSLTRTFKVQATAASLVSATSRGHAARA